VHEREREVRPALHAARVAADLAVRRLGEADALEQLGPPRGALGGGEPVQPALERHVLAPGEEVVERGLLQRGADAAAHLLAVAGDVEAGDRGGARGRRQERREHEDRGRLAGAVRPEEPVDLARRHLEVDPVDRPDAALELPDEALDDDAPPLSRAAHGRAP
jgi:hypothetical protein